jgi:hypothetical protein
LVIAKSVPYRPRMASVTTSPISDSQCRPELCPHSSERGMTTVDWPMTPLSSASSWAQRGSSSASISGSGVTAELTEGSLTEVE